MKKVTTTKTSIALSDVQLGANYRECLGLINGCRDELRLRGFNIYHTMDNGVATHGDTNFDSTSLTKRVSIIEI